MKHGALAPSSAPRGTDETDDVAALRLIKARGLMHVIGLAGEHDDIDDDEIRKRARQLAQAIEQAERADAIERATFKQANGNGATNQHTRKPRHYTLHPNLAPRGISREAAAEYIGVSATTFDEMVRDGRMPGPKQIGRRKVWDVRALEIAFNALPGDDEKNPWDDALANPKDLKL